MEPRTAGLLERFGYGEKKFFFVGAADQLDIDGQSFGRTAEGKRNAGKPARFSHWQKRMVSR